MDDMLYSETGRQINDYLYGGGESTKREYMQIGVATRIAEEGALRLAEIIDTLNLDHTDWEAGEEFEPVDESTRSTLASEIIMILTERFVLVPSTLDTEEEDPTNPMSGSDGEEGDDQEFWSGVQGASRKW